MFEGQPAQFLTSLQKLKKLPPSTAVYCAHEYTLSNLEFALAIEPENTDLIQLKQTVTAQRKNHQPSVPTLLQQELKLNPFLRTDDPIISQALSARLNIKIADEVSCFAHLRASKDQF